MLDARLTLPITVELSAVRDFEALTFAICTEPIRLFIISFLSQIVKDELALLQRRTAAQILAETRIAFSFCYQQCFLRNNIGNNSIS